MSTLPLVPLGLASWERSVQAAVEVWKRLLRSTASLDAAKIPYAVVGGNAVAVWVGRVDKSATRFTQDVELLINRSDLQAAKAALSGAGFVYRETLDLHMFLDGPSAHPRDAVHVLFSLEKVRGDDAAPNPAVTESERGDHFQVVSLPALARMKLTSFRLKDQVHLQDMISIGLIDESWLKRFPPELSARLKQILDTPNG